MSTYTQRLANRFPLWTTVRKSPASMGQRLMSVFADWHQYDAATKVRVSDSLHIMSKALGRPEVQLLELDAADYMSVTAGPTGGVVETPPTLVRGTLSATNYTCEQVENLQELTHKEPTRLEAVKTWSGVTSFDVWSSAAPTSYASIDIPNRLSVRVSDSTEYKKKTRSKHRQFSGFIGVVLEGTDLNDIDIKEVLPVVDDGLYETRNIFKTLTSVKTDGFNGNVAVSSSTALQGLYVDPYRVAILKDLEGQMELRVEAFDTDLTSTAATKLTLSTQRLKRGADYRFVGNTVLDNTEDVAELTIRDAAGANYSAVDFALSHENMHLYVLDDSGNIHIYDYDLPEFLPPSIDIPMEDIKAGTDMEVIPLCPYTLLESTDRLWTWLARPRVPILGVEIKRVDPAGNVTYLQANKSWAAGVYKHQQNTDAKSAEESWQDFSFTTEYDQVGQWEYYVTTSTQLGTGIDYRAVCVGGQDAVKSLATGVANPTSLHFGANGNLYVGDASDLYEIREAGDYYFADFNRQRLFLREKYDTTLVTI